MSAVWLWARRDLRRRWRAILALALIAALAGGLAMAAATGARRSQVVIAEAMREHREPDATSAPGGPGIEYWRTIARLPYVDAYGLYASTGLCLSETGGLTSSTLCIEPPVRGGWFDSISRLEMLEGRLPSRPDELVVNRPAQRRFGFQVGQVVHLEGISKDRRKAAPESLGPLDDYWNQRPRGDRPWGPTYTMRIVGVYAGQVATRLLDGGVERRAFQLAPAFMRAHATELDHYVDAHWRLRDGEADIGRLRRDIARLLGPDVPVRNLHDARRRVERSTSLEAAALWAVALAIAAAALVLVGQALARLVQARAGDAAGLRGVGMSQRQLTAALVAPGLLVGVAAALGAPVVAVAASPAVPIGLARSFDLDPGVRIDALVLVVGTLAVLAATALVAGASAWRAARGQTERASRRPGRVLRGPVPFGLGAGWALGSGTAVPSVVVAVAAAVAAFTVRAGIDDALAEPARAGMVWDVVVETPDNTHDAFFRADEAVAGASRFRGHFVSIGQRTVLAYVATAVRRPLEPVAIEGRLPERDDEVALGPATARDLQARVGDSLAGGLRVVGRAFLPNRSGHEPYDEGAWLTEGGYERVGPGPKMVDQYFVDLRDDADPRAFAARVKREGGTVNEIGIVEPAGITNLTNIRGLPALLAAFFALLGTAAVGHALVTTVRRRRRDLAVLRALGMTRGQARAAVASHATALAIAGVAVGIPLGVLAGQITWRWFATELPLAYVAPVGVLAAALAVPATVALVNAVAVAPGRAAARMSPAAALRAE